MKREGLYPDIRKAAKLKRFSVNLTCPNLGKWGK
jgi:hypothetical protein